MVNHDLLDINGWMLLDNVNVTMKIKKRNKENKCDCSERHVRIKQSHVQEVTQVFRDQQQKQMATTDLGIRGRMFTVFVSKMYDKF